jgi:peptidoglycan L-alanyl-D-glutamate endopeptidase CwlK
LENVHPDLVQLAWDVGTYRDIDVVQGARTIAEEEQAIATGHSSLKYPTSSKHVIVPGIREKADAVDITPHPVNWADLPAFRELGALVKERAAILGIDIRWGGDWIKFHDYDHFERVG